MSKRGKIEILILFTLLVAGGCVILDNEDKFYPLDAKYKITFNVGDVLNYEDQIGNSFQLKITDIKKDYRVTSRYGSGAPLDHVELQKVYYDSLMRNPNVMQNQVTAYTEQQTGFIKWFGRLDVRLDLGSIYLESLHMNGHTYNSVYKFDMVGLNDLDIVTWYYTYEYGFVGIVLNNGQEFSLEMP